MHCIKPNQKHNKHTHTHTHTHGFCVGQPPGELVPDETFTHLHLPWSSIVPYLLLPSNSTEITSSNPSLSLNPLLGILSCSFMPHIHLTILISAR